MGKRRLGTAGFHGVWKKIGHFPGKKIFGLLVWKKEIIFQTWSFAIHFHNILFKIDKVCMCLT